MKKVSFATKMINYFTNPKFYLSTTFQPLSENVKTLGIVLFLLAVVWGVVRTSQDIPVAIDYSKRVSEDIISHYPNDLQFIWENDSLQYVYSSQNLEETPPLTVPFSSVLPEFPETVPNKFAYITNSTESPESLEIKPAEYLLFLNSQKIYTASDIVNSEWESTPHQEFLSEVDSFTLTKQDVVFISDLMNKLLNEYKVGIQAVYLLLLIPVFIASKIWILFIESVFVILFFKIYNMRLTAKQTLSLTISVFIPTTIVASLATILYGPISFPLNTFAFWIVLIFVLYSLKDTAMVQIRSKKKES